MPARLGVQLLGDSAGLTAALGESVAATNRWASETEGAAVRVEEAFAGVATSTLKVQAAQDRLAISTLKYGQGSLGAAEATIRYRQQVDALAASHLSAARSIGRGLTTYVTAPTVLLGYEATKMGITFQTEMLRIQTQAGASAQEVKNLNGQVLAMAGSVGVAPAELARGLFHLESLGLRGAAAMQALKEASIAAGASGANLEDVTTALGGAIVTGISGVQNYHEAMAGLIAIAGEGNMRMSDLTEALGTGVLPAAKNAGVSLREVGAALAALTDRGMSAENAGTRLRMTFALMQHPSNAAKKALADLGIESGQMAAMLRQPNGLLHVLQLLHDRMDVVGKNRGARDVLGAFGGGRSGAGILTLIQSLDSGVSSYQQKLVGYDDGVRTASAKMAAYQQSNAFKLHQAGASVEADMVKLGGALAPVEVAAGKVIAGIAAGFTALPGPVKTEIGVIVGALAVGGPLILAIVGVKRAIQSIGRAFGLLPAESAPGIAATGAEVEASIGGAVATTEAEVSALRLSLLGLGGLAIAPIVIPLVINEIKNGKNGTLSRAATAGANAVTNALGIGNSGGGLPTYAQYERAAQHPGAAFEAMRSFMRAAGITDPRKLPGGPLDITTALSATQGLGPHHTLSATVGQGPHHSAPLPTAPSPSSTSPATVAGFRPSRATELNLALAKNPNDKAAINAKLAYDREAAAFAEKRIREGRGSATLVQQLSGVYGDEQSLRDRLKSLATAADQAAKKQESAAKKAEKIADQFNLPLRLQLRLAKAQAGGKNAEITSAEEAERRYVLAKIHAGKLTVQAEIAAYNELTSLNQSLATATKTTSAHVRFASLASLTAGITDPNVRKAVEARIAQAQAHSGHTPTGIPATYVTVTGPIHVHGVQDPQGLIDAISEHGARGAASRRGANAGHYLGRH